MNLALSAFFAVAAVVFAAAGLDVLANAADFDPALGVRAVGLMTLALSPLMAVLAVALLFVKGAK